MHCARNIKKKLNNVLSTPVHHFPLYVNFFTKLSFNNQVAVLSVTAIAQLTVSQFIGKNIDYETRHILVAVTFSD